jgi:tetraacyldisaccharide 4'-kinase
LRDDQQLFFSDLEHGAPRAINGPAEVPAGPAAGALLVTGIADPGPLLAHARTIWGNVEHVAFRDHHAFSEADARGLAERMAIFASPSKTLVTTEKDAVRLRPHLAGALRDIPVAVVPVKARILNDPERFNELLRRHLGTDQAHG